MPTLNRHLSGAASFSALRYLHFAEQAPDDTTAMLCYGTLALGAASLVARLQQSAGLEESPGYLILTRTADELRQLSQVPGNHAEELRALTTELTATWLNAEEQEQRSRKRKGKGKDKQS